MISAELVSLGEDRFLGPAQTETPYQVFGGHFAAQALLAALRTTAEGQTVHSLHSYFLKAGDSSVDIKYRVERIREGRSSSTRHVIAMQGEHEVFRLMASFSVERGETPHIFDAIPSAPHYSELSTHVFEGDFAWAGGIECRYVNLPGKQNTDETKVLVWLRINDELSEQLEDSSVALAFLSDATIGDGVFLQKGWSFEDPEPRYLSLDHSVWFHRQPPAGEWLLFEQLADWIGAGRCLARARVFSESGELIATCSQEALAYTKA